MKFILMFICFFIVASFTACNNSPQKQTITTSSSISNIVETNSVVEGDDETNHPLTTLTNTVASTQNYVSETKYKEEKVTEATSFSAGQKSRSVIKFEPNAFQGYNNSESKETVVQNIYNADGIVNNLILFESKTNTQSSVITYNALNRMYPIECIRNCNGNIYAIYKIEQGGYYYVFFDNNMNVANSAYISKKISYSDFENIKTGTPASQVENLEPTVKYLLSKWQSSKYNPFVTLILSDGILRVSFSRTLDGSYEVADINYTDDFILVYDTDAYYCELNYEILEKDYPQ